MPRGAVDAAAGEVAVDTAAGEVASPCSWVGVRYCQECSRAEAKTSPSLRPWPRKLTPVVLMEPSTVNLIYAVVSL